MVINCCCYNTCISYSAFLNTQTWLRNMKAQQRPNRSDQIRKLDSTIQSECRIQTAAQTSNISSLCRTFSRCLGFPQKTLCVFFASFIDVVLED